MGVLLEGAAYLFGMATPARTSEATHSIRDRAGRNEAAQREARSPLPDGFDARAWTRAACERSGVPLGVVDPVALGKLRTLTRTGKPEGG